MNKLIAVAAIAFGLAMSGPALAHGAKPKHGGVVASSADLAFELVTKDGKAVIHVDDHGRPLSTRDAKGTLTILQGKNKIETELEPGAHNTLSAKAPLKLAKGNKAVATIHLAGKEPIRVRFALK